MSAIKEKIEEIEKLVEELSEMCNYVPDNRTCLSAADDISGLVMEIEGKLEEAKEIAEEHDL